MPVDNQLYDRMADTWWDEGGFLHLLKALNPARFGYMRRVLVEELGRNPAGLEALDVGCGGGLLAEEFAALGCRVTGVDPSAESLSAARAHAASAGLAIDYRQASGEVLPFADSTFDLAYCCDVLEHVDDLPRVIRETARVLKPGGLYFYDTINRTLRSKLVLIKLFQEWSSTRFMPPNLHDWAMFIKPKELEEELRRSGLAPRGLTGLKPRINPLRLLSILRARKQGRISYLEAIERANVGESRDVSVQYMGWAEKPSG